jgi:hypothetical protein
LHPRGTFTRQDLRREGRHRQLSADEMAAYYCQQALITGLFGELLEVTDITPSVNCGPGKARSPRPGAPGARIRLHGRAGEFRVP